VIVQYLFHIGITQSSRWPERVREIVQRDAVENGALINALRIEPELGTPTRGGLPAILARRVPGGWSVTGHKIYSTGIPALKWLGVWGRTDETEPRTGFFPAPPERARDSSHRELGPSGNARQRQP
jgi:alkylation response protein AidB-like acyl-CoA dehydrogenase